MVFIRYNRKINPKGGQFTVSGDGQPSATVEPMLVLPPQLSYNFFIDRPGTVEADRNKSGDAPRSDLVHQPRRKAVVTLELPENYRPSPDETYMNPQQLAYFRNKLQAWRQDLVEESQETLSHLREEEHSVGDEVDRANRENETGLELRTRDRYRKLLNKIDAALRRIEDGSYGYCEDTGEEIGLGRLEARPVATLTVEAQERRERMEGKRIGAL